MALSGRFGIDLDLAALSENDLAMLRRAITVARRTQPIVQHGELVRLVMTQNELATGVGVQLRR